MSTTLERMAPEWTATDAPNQPLRHPKGSQARVLLTGVFGPYAQDDEFGSRTINPMELYHNQVTRVQGPFSLRMFHRSWGLMMIQANIAAPCTQLDFPVYDRFVEELQTNEYDIIGISSIIVNRAKVAEMCRLIRQYQPQAKIVVGGHIGNVPDLDRHIDADYIVQGDGVRWFREYLGEPTDRPLRHPMTVSGMGARCMGVMANEGEGEVAATLIPSVGCPLGCNFCSTSAMFGGKGKFVNFYESGDDLFEIMCQLEETLKIRSFFVMDENFLLHRKRALRLLDLMEEHDKSWSLYVFASANILRSYTMEQLLSFGISWVWMGLEGKDSQYLKLKNIDSRELVEELRSNGIKVLGSTIIGMDEHTPENVHEAMEHAASHNTDFHQFMLYTPLPGTPLHKEMTERGVMKSEDEYAFYNMHGQHSFNYEHRHFKNGEETGLLVDAFQTDFDTNGPSLLRIIETLLRGWKKHKDHPDPRVRERIRWEARELSSTYVAVVAATKRYYRGNKRLHAKFSALLSELKRQFGFKARLYSAVGGPFVYHKMMREQKQLDAGWTYEPPTFYEMNETAFAAKDSRSTASLARAAASHSCCQLAAR